MKKISLIGGSIICVFLLLSLPLQSIYATEPNDYEEITVRISGIPGFDINTITLSNGEYERLEQIFDELKINFANIDSKKETINLYRDVLNELNELGLYDNYEIELLNKYLPKELALKPYSIIGETSHTYFIPKGYRLIEIFYTILEKMRDISIEDDSIFYPIWSYIVLKFYNSGMYLIAYERLLLNINKFFPFRLFNNIALGKKYFNFMPRGRNRFYPAKGWLQVKNRSGQVKNYTERIVGNISTVFLIIEEYYVGIEGFIGISIMQEKYHKHYYFGFASKVDIK